MAFLATASYHVIFVGFICIGDWSEKKSDWPDNHRCFALCNLWFLLSSVVYAPLMSYAFIANNTVPPPAGAMRWEKVYVLAILVAVSAIGMAICACFEKTVCACFEKTEWWVITTSIILRFIVLYWMCFGGAFFGTTTTLTAALKKSAVFTLGLSSVDSAAQPIIQPKHLRLVQTRLTQKRLAVYYAHT